MAVLDSRVFSVKVKVNESKIQDFMMKQSRAATEPRKMKPETEEETSKAMAKARTTGSSSGSVNVYAVQCKNCFKWREIPSQEEYEEIRSNFTDDPWICNIKSGISCDDPADIEYDNSRTWVIDKPNIPKTPAGFKRLLIVRRDYSKCDAYYLSPNGKRVKCPAEVQRFLEAHPECKELKVNASDFNFTVPKVMEDTVPVELKPPVSESSNKKGKRWKHKTKKPKNEGCNFLLEQSGGILLGCVWLHKILCHENS